MYASKTPRIYVENRVYGKRLCSDRWEFGGKPNVASVGLDLISARYFLFLKILIPSISVMYSNPVSISAVASLTLVAVLQARVLCYFD